MKNIYPYARARAHTHTHTHTHTRARARARAYFFFFFLHNFHSVYTEKVRNEKKNRNTIRKKKFILYIFLKKITKN